MRAGKGMGGGGNRMGPVWYIISWIVLIFFVIISSKKFCI